MNRISKDGKFLYRAASKESAPRVSASLRHDSKKRYA